MNWVLWVLLMVPLGVPLLSLMVDRMYGVPARRQWVVPGIPLLAVFVGSLIYAAAVDDPILQLVGWGALAGVLGTVLLDVVRLTGVKKGAFPVDMPELFGMIALGLTPRLQRNMMKDMVSQTSTLPHYERMWILEARLKALARMPAQRREAVMAGMMAGLGQLPEDRRQAMLQTQMAILSEMPSEQRRALMMTMDSVMAHADGSNGRLPYPQPRGMPRVPMAIFRQMASRAFPITQKEAGVSKGTVLSVGYFWHFVSGATLGVPYTLLFGQGNWGVAIAWGVFVWLVMMVVMPPMMPMVRFPRWFPIVPFIAHIAFAIPFALIGPYLVNDAAHVHSLVGALSQ